MSDGEHADAAGQIDEGIPIDVEHEPAVRALDHHVRGSAEAGRCGCGTAGEHLARQRSGNVGLQSNVRHGQFP